jgi:hypothetical protein
MIGYLPDRLAALLWMLRPRAQCRHVLRSLTDRLTAETLLAIGQTWRGTASERISTVRNVGDAFTP